MKQYKSKLSKWMNTSMRFNSSDFVSVVSSKKNLYTSLFTLGAVGAIKTTELNTRGKLKSNRPCGAKRFFLVENSFYFSI